MAKKEYLVGWNYKSPDIVYGGEDGYGYRYLKTLTLPQARKRALKLGEGAKKRCIYKLVMVEEIPNE